MREVSDNDGLLSWIVGCCCCCGCGCGCGAGTGSDCDMSWSLEPGCCCGDCATPSATKPPGCCCCCCEPADCAWPALSWLISWFGLAKMSELAAPKDWAAGPGGGKLNWGGRCRATAELRASGSECQLDVFGWFELLTARERGRRFWWAEESYLFEWPTAPRPWQ